jgi:hypothetical protein
MIQRENKKLVDLKQKNRKRDFDQLVDYMTEQYLHRAIVFDPREAKRRHQR